MFSIHLVFLGSFVEVCDGIQQPNTTAALMRSALELSFMHTPQGVLR